MKTNIYVKLQKKFGGNWVASSSNGKVIFASAKGVGGVFKKLKEKKISPQKTVIGFIDKYGQVSAYFSLPV
jgi:hypothetical protein